MKIDKSRILSLIAASSLGWLLIIHAEALRRGGSMVIDVNSYGEDWVKHIE